MSTALVLDGMTIVVERGGSTRRARLTVERDGSLHLRAAADVERAELRAFVASKREWIYSKLAEKELLRTEPVSKELVNGEGFLYLGRSYQLRIADNGGAGLRLDRGRLVLPAHLATEGYAHVIEWYQARAAAWLRPRLANWATRLKVELHGIEAADLGHKWGSATPDGRVRIHWATMQLRPELIDYVLAHEVAHMKQPHHGPAFWALLSRVLPDYGDRRERLAHAGSGLWFGNHTDEQASPDARLGVAT